MKTKTYRGHSFSFRPSNDPMLEDDEWVFKIGEQEWNVQCAPYAGGYFAQRNMPDEVLYLGDERRKLTDAFDDVLADAKRMGLL